MSQYTINIDDSAIAEQMNKILDSIISREMKRKCGNVGDEISSAVKDIIYSRKDEIIDKVISRASTEIVKKGMPKLLDKVMKGGDE